jgi:hypothetical protein
VVYESQSPGPPPKIIVFQYNPEQLERKLENRAAEQKRGANAKENVLRVAGPPKETITLSVVLNAADQLEANDPTVREMGLHPVLATLEMLLYPTTFQVLQNEALSNQGAAQIKPADLPLTLLVWGRSRVVPVKIESFSVTEEAFDPNLNPIQVKVELGLLVLTYLELERQSQGRDLYLAFQRQKEVLAQQYQNVGGETVVRNILPGASGGP